MPICEYCGKEFKSLGIASHRASCRKKATKRPKNFSIASYRKEMGDYDSK